MKTDARRDALRFVANAAEHTLPAPPEQATRGAPLMPDGSGAGPGDEPEAERPGEKRQPKRSKRKKRGTKGADASAEVQDKPDQEGEEPAAAASGRGKRHKAGNAAAAAVHAAPGGAVDPVEAEFALALLQNDAVRQLATALAASRADLPAVNVDEARALVAAAQVRQTLGALAMHCERAVPRRAVAQTHVHI
jgi:hypothetical protein